MIIMTGKTDSNYWNIRTNIVNAIKNQDDDILKQYEQSHPAIFNGLVAQAKSSFKKKKRKSGKWNKQ